MSASRCVVAKSSASKRRSRYRVDLLRNLIPSWRRRREAAIVPSGWRRGEAIVPTGRRRRETIASSRRWRQTIVRTARVGSRWRW